MFNNLKEHKILHDLREYLEDTYGDKIELYEVVQAELYGKPHVVPDLSWDLNNQFYNVKIPQRKYKKVQQDAIDMNQRFGGISFFANNLDDLKTNLINAKADRTNNGVTLSRFKGED